MVPAAKSRHIILVLMALAGLGLGVYLGMDKGLTTGISVGVGGLFIVAIAAVLWKPPPPGKGGDAGAINFGT